ncbi:MAG TPA: HEAT repeat domain-containing protein [Clostridia bacterium]|nr:HEAT repeat domain-containing protein [Clostridia bacterium]
MSPEPSRVPHISQTDDKPGPEPVTNFHTAPAIPARKGLSRAARMAWAALVLVIALGSVFFWRGGWGAFQDPDQQISRYIRDDAHPRMQESAVRRIGEATREHRPTSQWSPELFRLAKNPDQHVRVAVAWAMGQDTQRGDFHRVLTGMLNDSAPDVRAAAALSLVQFGDRSGHDQIVLLLEPVRMLAAQGGRVVKAAKTGTLVRAGEPVARLRNGDAEIDVPAPVSGRVSRSQVRSGDELSPGTPVATLDPAPEQAYAALHALYQIGEPGDLANIARYLQDVPDIPASVREQAALAEQSIRARADVK